MDKLPPQAVEHFNKLAKEFSDNLVVHDFGKNVAPPSKVMSSSHKQVPMVDFGKMGFQPEILRVSNAFDELEEIYQDTPKGWIGLNHSQINDFKKFVKSLLSKFDWISYKTLEDISFKWIIKKNIGDEKADFIGYLLNWKNINVGSHFMYFSIKNLSIETSFQFGKIVIGFYTEETLNSLLSDIKKKVGKFQEQMIKERYIGTVVACCSVDGGEIDIAKEVGYKECALTVDALKMFTTTVDFPQLNVNFDLDRRVSETLYEQDVLVIRAVPNTQNLLYATFNTKRAKTKTFQIDKAALKLMRDLGADLVHQFLIKNKDSELCKLISQSIQYFAATLSQPDLHRRVVDIFTIMESLTLKSADDKIISVLSTYVPKVLTKDPTERKGIAKLLKTMYGIRSAVIHHGKRQDFDMNDLANLQRCLRVLILRLIELSDKHVKKDTILQEIDDAINEAY